MAHIHTTCQTDDTTRTGSAQSDLVQLVTMPYRVEMMNETAAWPLSEIAAQQINRLRKRAGLNREQLAERCRELGAPANMTAAAVANIETGRPDAQGRRRRDLTVEELVIFALALNVAPLLLLFPVGLVKEEEVLPETMRPTWLAAKWFAGDQPWCSESDEDGRWYADRSRLDAWRQNSAGVDFYRLHERHIHDWDEAQRRAEVAREEMAAAEDAAAKEVARREAEAQDARAGQMTAALRQLRWSARRQGLIAPPLPPELVHLDEEDVR